MTGSWLALNPATEHTVIALATFFFPPPMFIVVIMILLAMCGKPLGLRERYTNALMLIFEWGARQVKVEEQQVEIQEGLSDQQSSSDNPSSPASGLRRRCGFDQNIIERVALATTPQFNNNNDDDDDEDDVPSSSQNPGWADVWDSLHFIKAGVEAIIEDNVTSRFEAEQLASWNMLTRTSIGLCQFVNWKLTLLWVSGWLLRYTVLLPLRVALFVIGLLWMISTTAIVGLVPESRVKRWANRQAMLISHRILTRSVTAVLKFHDRQNMARNGGICVANHTSPIDVAVLSTDNVYALIGQSHGGLLGLIQRSLSRASSHIWFERSQAKDRIAVANALRAHVDDPNKLPILIFPEGTCINNTSVMQFKKGCFEVGATIYPIAMKYESRFGDPFWNSSKQSMVDHIFRIMTSWAIICNIWYLPPMQRKEDESAIEFAARVKREIARKGGFVDLDWDGQLKRQRVPQKLVAEQQQKYFNSRLSRMTSVESRVRA